MEDVVTTICQDLKTDKNARNKNKHRNFAGRNKHNNEQNYLELITEAFKKN